jgi:hypothetical protein
MKRDGVDVACARREHCYNTKPPGPSATAAARPMVRFQLGKLLQHLPQQKALRDTGRDLSLSHHATGWLTNS